MKADGSGSPIPARVAACKPQPDAKSAFEMRMAVLAAEQQVPWIEGMMGLVVVYGIAPAVLFVARPTELPTRAQLLLALVVWWMQMVGVNCGYHRLFAHGSFKAYEPVRPTPVRAASDCMRSLSTGTLFAALKTHSRAIAHRVYARPVALRARA